MPAHKNPPPTADQLEDITELTSELHWVQLIGPALPTLSENNAHKYREKFHRTARRFNGLEGGSCREPLVINLPVVGGHPGRGWGCCRHHGDPCLEGGVHEGFLAQRGFEDVGGLEWRCVVTITRPHY